MRSGNLPKTVCQIRLLLLLLLLSRSVMSDSVIPWTAAHQASLYLTISRRLLKLMSIGSVMPSNHLIPCGSLLLLPSVFPSIRLFSNEVGSSHQVAKVLEF